MYAIIEDSGSQIKVSEGDVIRVDVRELPEDAAALTFDKILLIGGEEGQPARIGQPTLEGVTVEADILEEYRDDKIAVVKFKRRKGYKRMKGHRQNYLRVRVTRISV